MIFRQGDGLWTQSFGAALSGKSKTCGDRSFPRKLGKGQTAKEIPRDLKEKKIMSEIGKMGMLENRIPAVSFCPSKCFLQEHPLRGWSEIGYLQWFNVYHIRI